MIYRFDMTHLPQATRAYSVVRRTVWQVADPYHILLYIQKGSCLLETGGRQYTLKEGDVFFLPENTMYVRRPIDDALCTIFYTHFSLPGMQTLERDEARREALEWKTQMDTALLLPDFMVQTDLRLYLKPLIHMQDRRDALEKLIALCEAPENRMSVQHVLQISLWVTQMLVEASGAVLDSLMDDSVLQPAEHTPEKLRQAILYIRQHESEKVSLADLCRVCSVSKQQMIRYFRQSLNTTPIEYITHYKVNKAMELFARAPDLTIKEIAWEVGYDDQCYFSRVFTRVTGESPTSFRSRVVGFDEQKHIAEAQI